MPISLNNIRNVDKLVFEASGGGGSTDYPLKLFTSKTSEGVWYLNILYSDINGITITYSTEVDGAEGTTAPLSPSSAGQIELSSVGSTNVLLKVVADDTNVNQGLIKSGTIILANDATNNKGPVDQLSSEVEIYFRIGLLTRSGSPEEGYIYSARNTMIGSLFAFRMGGPKADWALLTGTYSDPFN